VLELSYHHGLLPALKGEIRVSFDNEKRIQQSPNKTERLPSTLPA